MPELIEDNRSRRQFQKLLSRNPKNKVDFKNIVYCGTVSTGNGLLLVRQRTVDGGIKNAKFLGLKHCANGFFCPVCSARVARRQGKWIAGALETERAKNRKAFMMTLTIGHALNIPLSALLKALDLSWKMSFARRNCKIKGLFGDNSYKEFTQAIEIRHYIKALEITWSPKYGWHPHYHVLFFVDADKFDKVLNFEERLQKMWQKLTEFYLTRDLTGLTEKQKEAVRAVYSGKTDNSVGLYISKNDRGEIIEQKSSSYIAGWSSAEEISGLSKKGRKSSYSIMELIQTATNGRDAKTAAALSLHHSFSAERKKIYIKKSESQNILTDNLPEMAESCKMNLNELKPAEGSRKKEFTLDAARALRLVKAAMYAIYKKYTRFSWSHTGLKKQANDWLWSLTEDEYKKKFIGEVKLKTEIVAYFPYEVADCLINCTTDWPYVEAEILKYAYDENGFSTIAEITKKLTGSEPLRYFPGKLYGIEAAA